MGILENFSRRAYEKVLDGLPEDATRAKKIKELGRERIWRSFKNAVYELGTDVLVVGAGTYAAYELFKRGENGWHITAHITAGYAFTKVATRVYDWLVGKHAILDYLEQRLPRDEGAEAEIEQTVGKRGVITLGSLAAGVGIELAQGAGLVSGTATIDGFARTVTSATVANGTSLLFDGTDDVDDIVFKKFVKKVEKGEL